MRQRTHIEQACSAQHDGELNAQRAAQLAAALEREPSLESAVDELAALDDALATWSAPEPGDEFAQRVMAELPVQSPAPAGFWRRAWQPTLAAAAFAGAMLCGGLVGRQLQPMRADLDSVSAAAFDPLPPDSVAGQYVALMLQEDQ